MKKTTVWLGVALVVIVFLSLVVDFRSDNIVFNQNFEEDIFKEFSTYSGGGHFMALLSNYSARLNNFLNGYSPPNIDVSDPFSVFNYVWSKIPFFAIVYPTEQYYYFSIPGVSLAGNLRFVDAENGMVSFAYFNTEDPSQFQHKVLSSEEGFEIKMISDRVVYISYAGKKARFLLPLQDSKKPAGLELLPEEEFVVKVQDESASRLFLIFNNETKSFYYIADEEKSITENLSRLDERLLRGDRTGFVYYEEKQPARKILVGVDAYNIMENNYYDGPFDQVPPRLPLRDKLYKAYPYTQYMNGLDEHGNFLDFEGQRVAISPYTDYYGADAPEVREVLASCAGLEKTALWSCLTYESKKDFHKTIPEFFYPDGTKK